MPRITYPRDNQYWIELPEQWLGKHAQRRDQAIGKAEKYLSETLTSFSVALALLDNWNLPGLSGNPEVWDFTQLDLTIIAWVITVTLSSFNECWQVPKNS